MRNGYIECFGSDKHPGYKYVELNEESEVSSQTLLKPNAVRLTLPEDNCTGRRSIAVKDVLQGAVNGFYKIPIKETKKPRVTLKSQREQLQSRVLARAERMLNETIERLKNE